MDKTLTCKVCDNEFIFSEGEQGFYSDRKLDEPKRCPDCRRKQKEKKVDVV